MRPILLLAICAGAFFLFHTARQASYVGFFLDDARYIGLARAMADGKGYVDLWSPSEPPHRLHQPGFPLLLVPFVKEVENRHETLKWVNITLTTLAIPLCHRLFHPALPAPFLWLLLLLLPTNTLLVTYATSVMSDPFFLVLLLGFFVLLSRHRLHPSWGSAVAAGLLAAACTLTRTVGLLLLLPLLYLGIRRRDFPLIVGGVLPTTILLAAAAGFGWMDEYVNLPSAPFRLDLSSLLANALHYAGEVVSVLGGRYLSFPPVPAEGALLWLLLIPVALGFVLHWRRGITGWEIYVLGYFLAISHFQWRDSRLLLPLLPFMYYFLLQGIAPLRRKPLLALVATGVPLLLALRGLFWFFPHMVRASHPMNTPDRETFAWLAQHTRPADIVLSEVAPRCFLLTGRKSLPFSRRPERYQMLDYIFSGNVRYVYFTIRLATLGATPTIPPALEYEEMIREDPRHFKPVFQNPRWQSIVYEVLPRRAAFEQALEATNRGAVLYSQKRYGEAAALLKEALEIEPDFYLPLNLLGMVLADGGEVEEGIRVLVRSTSLHPTLERGYAAMAYAFAKAGERGRAADALRKGIELAKARGRIALAQQLETELAKLSP